MQEFQSYGQEYITVLWKEKYIELILCTSILQHLHLHVLVGVHESIFQNNAA